MDEFVSIMGFNKEEVERDLKPYAEKFAERQVKPYAKKFAKGQQKVTAEKFEEKKQLKYNKIMEDLKTWYGKHRFSITDTMELFNPASVCSCLWEEKFGGHIGNSAIISTIKQLLKENNKKMED